MLMKMGRRGTPPVLGVECLGHKVPGNRLPSQPLGLSKIVPMKVPVLQAASPDMSVQEKMCRWPG